MFRPCTPAAALLALAVAAAPAEGQLLRRLQQAAKDRAAEALGGDAPAARAAAGGPSRDAAADPAGAKAAPRAPLAITPERLDQFLAAMRPAAARAERGRAERAARRAYEAEAAVVDAHNQRVQACAERVMAQEQPRLMTRIVANPGASQELTSRLQGNDPRIGPLTEAALAASTRGDHARARALGDSALKIRFQVVAGVVPALRSCGVPRSGPAEPVVADARAPEELIVPPAGMTRGQFGRLRERVALYALGGGAEQPYTPEERASLDARAGDLAKLAPLFRDGLLEWTEWGVESGLGRAWGAPPAQP